MMTSDESITEPIRHTPVAGAYDVVIAGGGPAGIAAAVASSRNGAKTLLVERYGFLGGMMTAGMVNCVNGFRNQRGPNDRQAVAGIAQELVERIAERGGAYLPKVKIPYCVVVDQEVALAASLSLVILAGSSVLLHTLVTNPIKEGGNVTGIITQNKAGRRAYRCKTIVDCTGDGDLASGAGVAYSTGRPEDGRYLPLQLMFRMREVDMTRLAKHLSRNGSGLNPMYDIEPLESAPEAAEAGRPFGASGVVVKVGGEERRIAMLAWRGQALLWATRSLEADALNPGSLTESEIKSREDLGILVDSLREIPGFEEARLDRTAPQVGVRETRHMKGEYVLTRDDVLSGASFDDSIAVGANPMACLGERPILDHDGFEIPLRCLLPDEVNGLLLAGRCISVTHQAHGSIRAMATCMATGQAAGTAAALSVSSGEIPRYVSPPKLQELLTSQRAIVRQPR